MLEYFNVFSIVFQLLYINNMILKLQLQYYISILNSLLLFLHVFLDKLGMHNVSKLLSDFKIKFLFHGFNLNFGIDKHQVVLSDLIVI